MYGQGVPFPGHAPLANFFASGVLRLGPKLGPILWQFPVDRPLRHALEIRDDSFRDPVFIRLLREHGAALVCADTVEWPLLMDLTAGFVYCRLHGSEQLYVSGYDDAALDR